MGVGSDVKGTDDPEDFQKEATPPSRRALFGPSRGFRFWRKVIAGSGFLCPPNPEILSMHPSWSRYLSMTYFRRLPS